MMAHNESLPYVKGGWKLERTLGAGGFGTVVLWKNLETEENVAIKTCVVQNEMTPKHRQRWTLEVDIMKRLDHPNVISACNVPEPLDVGEAELPLLAMEYCSGGDLRKVLNKPENCCGLKEYDIRCLVKDIANAIEYLHNKRIIHRDLKPENIVLQLAEERIVYKLIDLGYAKELDQGSVCTSFVGTLQYLAPELFTTQKYTCTVDYWSFGTVVFECITGFRPFLPQVPPVQWHKEVCQKNTKDICVYYDVNGDIRYSDKLDAVNHLCRTMQNYFEQWLQLMLRWDARSRGGGLADSNKPKCFTYLDTILNMKIIHILHVGKNQLLSYPLTEQYSMQDLQRIVEQETGITVEEQDILLASGASPDPNLAASQCWNTPGEDDWVVFLFKKGEPSESQSRKFKPLPQRVQFLVKEPGVLLPYHEQKKSWGEAVFFCAEQVVDFKRLILSQRASMLSLLRTNSSFIKLKSKMVNECEHLMAKIKYFHESLQHDIDSYREQVSEGGLTADAMVRKWYSIGEEMNRYNMIREECTALDQQSTALQTKIVELQRSPFARSKQNEVLENMETESRRLYQEFRQAGKAGREAFKDHKPMVQVVVKCVMNRDKNLTDLYTHLGKICSCKHELYQILPGIQKCCQKIAVANEKLIMYQKQRQSDIWRLLKVAFERDSMVKQDSRTVNGSLLMSMQGDSSLESLQVMEESKETVKKFGQIMVNVLQEQEQMNSDMDWDFLNTAS